MCADKLVNHAIVLQARQAHHGKKATYIISSHPQIKMLTILFF
jgi:hypothetical protein